MTLLNVGAVLALGLPATPGTQAQEHAKMLKTVTPGDKIVTSGRVVATTVASVKKNAIYPVAKSEVRTYEGRCYGD